MRLLHLIDAVSSQAHSTTLAMLADAYGRLGDIEQRVYLLGGQALEKAAYAAGLLKFQRVGAPLGRAVFAWPSLRRAMKRNNEAHCWSLGALALATLMFRHVPRVLTLTVEPTARQIHWLRVLTAAGQGRCTLLPISSTIRRTVLSRGVAENAVHVLRPAIDMSKVVMGGRRELRETWDAEDPKTVVVAALGDPPGAVDAILAVSAAGFLREVMMPEGRNVRLLLHPRQRRRLQAKQMLRSQGELSMLVDEPRLAEPWRVLPGCDLALALGTSGPVRVGGIEPRVISSQQPSARHMDHGYLGAGACADDGGGGLSLLWAMASNIPIVGEATYAISEIVEDRHTALLARPGQYRLLAHRAKQVLGDKQLAWQLRDTARHECYSFFSRRRYCDSLRAVYQQMTEGRAVEVPQMESTGGLRFLGRG